MNVKNSDELNGRHIYSSSEYKSFHEEKTGNNNDINELDKNLNIDENMKQFDISRRRKKLFFMQLFKGKKTI